MTETYTINYSDLSHAEADRQALADTKDILGEAMFAELEICAQTCNSIRAVKLFMLVAPMIFGCRGRVLTALLRKHKLELFKQTAEADGVELTPDGFIIE